MKICWDNLEKIVYRNSNFFLRGRGKVKFRPLIYKDGCCVCGEPFLALRGKKGLFCSKKCAVQGEYNPFYGKKHSEDNKRKWSEQQSRFRHSDETKRKMSESHKSENNHFYGKKHSIETRKIIGAKIKGMFSLEKHWNWAAGISYLPYCLEWTKDYKDSIKERDGNKCRNPICNKIEDLTIHHIDYDKRNCQPENLLTLCRSCNSKANGNREYFKILYKCVMEEIRREYEKCVYQFKNA